MFFDPPSPPPALQGEVKWLRGPMTALPRRPTCRRKGMLPMAVDAEKASELIDNFAQAVIDFERAERAYAAGARREQAEARKALFDALTGGTHA